MTKDKCFRQWKIFWTIIASILSITVVYFLFFNLVWKDMTITPSRDYGIVDAITITSVSGDLFLTLMFFNFIALLFSTVSVFLIWGIRYKILYGNE